MTIGVRPGTAGADSYLQQFHDTATEAIRDELADEGQEGALRQLVFEDHPDGVWAIATFTVNSHPDVVFTRTRNVLPGTGTQWDAEFAAGLYATTLFEAFHTKAKHQEPVNGTIAY